MTGSSGLFASVGAAKETTYGTFVAPTHFVEFDSETLEWKPKRTSGKGLRNGGLFPRRSARHTTSATVDGDVVTPVYSKGMGLWLGMIFGTMGISPAQQATSTAYLQTHVLADNTGQSSSVQVGRPSVDDGVINCYSYLGCKVTKAVFEAKADEALSLTLTFDGKDEDKTETYTVPTYQLANAPFFWDQGEFQMGPVGSEVLVQGVRTFKLTIDRTQKTDRFYMNGTGRKSEPKMSDFVKVTGEIDTDFLTRAQFNDLFTADTPQSIIVPFTGSVITGSYNYDLTLKMPCCSFDQEGPKVAGPDIIQPKMQFTVDDDDTDTPLTCLYTSTDVTL